MIRNKSERLFADLFVSQFQTPNPDLPIFGQFQNHSVWIEKIDQGFFTLIMFHHSMGHFYRITEYLDSGGAKFRRHRMNIIHA